MIPDGRSSRSSAGHPFRSESPPAVGGVGHGSGRSLRFPSLRSVADRPDHGATRRPGERIPAATLPGYRSSRGAVRRRRRPSPAHERHRHRSGHRCRCGIDPDLRGGHAGVACVDGVRRPGPRAPRRGLVIRRDRRIRPAVDPAGRHVRRDRIPPRPSPDSGLRGRARRLASGCGSEVRPPGEPDGARVPRRYVREPDRIHAAPDRGHRLPRGRGKRRHPRNRADGRRLAVDRVRHAGPAGADRVPRLRHGIRSRRLEFRGPAALPPLRRLAAGVAGRRPGWFGRPAEGVRKNAVRG